jgi:hypothetical protein
MDDQYVGSDCLGGWRWGQRKTGKQGNQEVAQ